MVESVPYSQVTGACTHGIPALFTIDWGGDVRGMRFLAAAAEGEQRQALHRLFDQNGSYNGLVLSQSAIRQSQGCSGAPQCSHATGLNVPGAGASGEGSVVGWRGRPHEST